MSASDIKGPLRRMLVRGEQVEDPLRGRPPETLMPLFRALRFAGGGLSTWVVPHHRAIGVHWFPDPDALWLAMIDDLDLAAAGPGSFDIETLRWWTERARVIVVDAAKPDPKKYFAPAGLLARGGLTLVVQTPEERREKWHQFFRDVGDRRTKQFVLDFMNVPGASDYRVRSGWLGTGFPADAPDKPNPRPIRLSESWLRTGKWQDQDP